jgi:hypothetical protein
MISQKHKPKPVLPAPNGPVLSKVEGAEGSVVEGQSQNKPNFGPKTRIDYESKANQILSGTQKIASRSVYNLAGHGAFNQS